MVTETPVCTHNSLQSVWSPLEALCVPTGYSSLGRRELPGLLLHCSALHPCPASGFYRAMEDSGYEPPSWTAGTELSVDGSQREEGLEQSYRRSTRKNFITLYSPVELLHIFFLPSTEDLLHSQNHTLLSNDLHSEARVSGHFWWAVYSGI